MNSPKATEQSARQRSKLTGRFRMWSTPRRLKVFAGVASLLAILVGAFAYNALGDVRSGLNVIGLRAAPLVVNATSLSYSMSDMDAQVANLLLVGNRDDLGSTRQQSRDLYEADRVAANRSLQLIAVLGADNPDAQQQINVLLDDFGRYQVMAGQAMLIEQQATDPSPGRPPAEALGSYVQATDLMHGSLLPAAATLTQLNGATLNATYSNRQASGNLARWLVGLLGLMLIVVLVAYQIFLGRHFRRMFNPALAPATLIAIVLVALTINTLSGERHEQKVAKQDAFDSLIVLSRARAISADANADESRFLVDPARGDQYQQAFFDKTQQIAELQSATISTYDALLQSAVGAYASDRTNIVFGGFLGAEFRNITFVGERQAAEATLSAWQVYQRDDRQIRALNGEGRLAEAITFNTSHAQGDSNWAFDQYNAALSKLIELNQGAFDQAIHRGETGLDGRNVFVVLACLLIVLLNMTGTRPRLKEFT